MGGSGIREVLPSDQEGEGEEGRREEGDVSLKEERGGGGRGIGRSKRE